MRINVQNLIGSVLRGYYCVRIYGPARACLRKHGPPRQTRSREAARILITSHCQFNFLETSSSCVWKERSAARCGTAGFPEQMLPYRSAPRAASTDGCAHWWRVASDRKCSTATSKENTRSIRGRGESSPSVAATSADWHARGRPQHHARTASPIP